MFRSGGDGSEGASSLFNKRSTCFRVPHRTARNATLSNRWASGPNVRPGSLPGEGVAQRIAVDGVIGEEDLPGPGRPASRERRASWAWPSLSVSAIGRPRHRRWP